jgi:acetylornithine deacetylase/succinyl-diaminopimelate desuccinylase-like protein
VNCRILSGVAVGAVQATPSRLLAYSAIRVSPIGESLPSPASPLQPDLVGAVEALARAMWPGALMIPEMENGATDGLFLRNVGVPVQRVSGPLYDAADDRAHSRDERLSVRHFDAAREFWYRLVTRLSGGVPRG